MVDARGVLVVGPGGTIAVVVGVDDGGTIDGVVVVCAVF